VESTSPSKPHGLKFSLRGALLLTMLVALFFGWRASGERAAREITNLRRRLAYVESKQTWTESRADHLTRPAKRKFQHRGILSGADLSGVSLRKARIDAQTNGFQRTRFTSADLQDAKLSGGDAAFQGVVFDDANLRDATLTGGVSSFQLSSFVAADLSGAVLTGGGSSFQGSTFEGAALVGARLLCRGASFQAVNIDATDFRGADISALEAESLKSCYFKTSPTYDDGTKFPPRFDPVEEGWQRKP
jgi:hypothetical protein